MSIPTLAPNCTWFTQGGTTVKRESITEINIVDSYTPTGNETASWDASAAKDGGVMVYVTGTVLTIAGNGSGKIMANADSSYAFSDSKFKDLFDKVTVINGADKLDTSNVTSFDSTFQACRAIETVDVSGWNTENVQTMYCMFSACNGVIYLPVGNWNVSKVQNMSAMFQKCISMTEVNVSSWDTYACTNMQAMFYGCTALKTLDVSSWDTYACTDMMAMFYGDTSLENLDVSNWDVSNVTTMKQMFTCGNDFGATPMTVKELDVSKWNPKSCTDMSFMFYGCKGPKNIDVSNWNVSKVKNFDHMFAHSYLTVNGIGNWVTTSATNLNALFHSVQNTYLDVSKFVTDKVQFFCQMFQSAGKLTKIVGLENFDTANGLGFDEMFLGCHNLRELNLSSFDTSKAKDNVKASTNGHMTATMQNMFQGMDNLEKIILGEKFSFKGDGTTTNTSHYAVLPTPDSAYIPGADGNWYDIDKNAYAPSAIPDKTAGTYYASATAMDELPFSKIFLLHRMFSKPIAHAMTGRWFWWE